MTRAWVLSLAIVSVACQAVGERGASCERASECAQPLVCALGRCRAQCSESRDCPAGARCLAASRGAGVCSLEVESRCTDFCSPPLRCEADQCRTECTTDADCFRGRCVDLTCVEPTSGLDAGPPPDGGDDAAQGADAGRDASAGDTGDDAGADGWAPDAWADDAWADDAWADDAWTPDLGVDAGCVTGCQAGTGCAPGNLAGECGYGGHLCSSCASCTATGVCAGGDTCASPFDITALGSYVFAVDTCALADDVTVASCSTGTPGGGPDAILVAHLSAARGIHLRTDPPATIAYLSPTGPCSSAPVDCTTLGDFTSTGGGAGIDTYFAVESVSGTCGLITILVDQMP